MLLDEHRTVILRHESALKKLGQNRGEQSCSLSAMMRTFSFINSVLYKYMYIIFSECYRQSSHDENNSRRQMTQCWLAKAVCIGQWGGGTKLWCIHMNFNTIVFHCISNYGIYSIRESRKQYCIMNNKRIWCWIFMNDCGGVVLNEMPVFSTIHLRMYTGSLCDLSAFL